MAKNRIRRGSIAALLGTAALSAWILGDAEAAVTTYPQKTGVFANEVINGLGGLSAPGADRIAFWDESANTMQWLEVGAGLAVTGTTLSASGSGLGDVSGPASATDNAITRFDTTTGKAIQNSVVTVSDTGSIAGVENATFLTGAALRTGTTATNSLILAAYDVDGTAYTTFGTLTAANTPTFDLSDSVTKGGAYIYRAGGTDVPVTDGGTGASDAATARTNLSAAASGANTDLTSVYLNNTGLKIKDTNASHGLTLAPGSDLTVDRTLTINTGDSARTLTFSGNTTLDDWFDQSVKTTATPTFGSGTRVGGTTGAATLNVTSTGTGANGIEIGGSISGAADSFIDFHATNGTDNEARIIRSNGVNGAWNFTQTGSGQLGLTTATGTILFTTNSATRMGIDSSGNQYIGGAAGAEAGRFVTVSSAVNRLEFRGATTTNPPEIKTAGSDTDINLRLSAAGSGLIDLNAGVKRKLRVVTGAGSVTAAYTDNFIVVNKSSGAATTVDMPSCTPTYAGLEIVVKDGKGDAGTNVITVDPNSTQTVDGSTTFLINNNYQSASFLCNGSEWNVF